MAIKLTEAMLCLDCDTIHGVDESAGTKVGDSGACPACGSRHSWPLCNWVRPVYARGAADQPPRIRFHKYGRRLA